MSENHFLATAVDKVSHARLGELILRHGTVETPVFLPVGTQATVRSVTPQELDCIGVKIILCNAYHLSLRPGVEEIIHAGGLHKFMGWRKPMLTDSGGYQIFSLSSFRKIREEGVEFRSHIDGSAHYITPEGAIKLQEDLGADIIMALDVCPESSASSEILNSAVTLTAKWAVRCWQAHGNTGQLLFGIVQGGIDNQLRKTSAMQITEIDFPGFAIGGLSLGETKSQMWESVDAAVELLPRNKPRYLMGVGSPEDIFEGVSRGIDIFDSALPTRVARNGALFTRKGRINIKRSAFASVYGPVDPDCKCFACMNFSAAYMHHLFKCEELLAYRLATIHNLFFMNMLTEEIRSALSTGSFNTLKDDFLSGYSTTDEDRRLEQKLRSVEGKKTKTDDPC